MRYFPIFLDLKDKTVLILGGGPIAANKLRLFAKTEARLCCVAREFNQEIRDFIASGRATGILADPAKADLDGALIVVAATETGADEIIARRASESGLLVNAVDKTQLCGFIAPSIVDRGRVIVAIGTEGEAPVLARRLRERIEALLPANLDALAEFIGRRRALVAKALPEIGDRRFFWEAVVDGEIGRLIFAGRFAEAEEALRAALGKLPASARAASLTLIVSPKAADDLTIKALRALQDADLILHGETIAGEILDRARRDAERKPLPRSASMPAAAMMNAFSGQIGGARRIVGLLDPATGNDDVSALAKALRANGLSVDVCARAYPIELEADRHSREGS